MSATHGGKGSTYRPFDRKRFSENFDKIKWNKDKETDKLEEIVSSTNSEIEDDNNKIV